MLVLESSSSLNVLSFVGGGSFSYDRGRRGGSNRNDSTRSELELESSDKRAALGDGIESLVSDEVGVGGDVMGSAGRSVNNSRSVTIGLAVVTSEGHIKRSKDGNTTEGFEARLDGLKLGVSGGIGTLDLRREGSSCLGGPVFTVSSALLDSIGNTGGTDASESEEELLHLNLINSYKDK